MGELKEPCPLSIMNCDNFHLLTVSEIILGDRVVVCSGKARKEEILVKLEVEAVDTLQKNLSLK